MENVRHLALSGGGARGAAYIGVLKFFKQKFGIDYGARTHKLESIVATSIGTIIGFFICIGYTVEQIESYVVKFSITEAINFDLVDPYSLSDGESFRGVLAQVLKETYGEGSEDMTLKDLYERSKIDLVCTSTSTSSGTAKFFRARTDPKVRVIDAIYASCCIPFMYQAFRLDDDSYVDGGFILNYPMNVFDTTNTDPASVLGIRFDLDRSDSSTTFIGYLMRIMFISFFYLNDLQFDILRPAYKRRTLTVNLTDSKYNPIKFLSASKDEIKEYIDSGFQSAEMFCSRESCDD